MLFTEVIEEYGKLLNSYFHFYLLHSRKNHLFSREVTIMFYKENFYHLAGIHYLKDVESRVPSNSRVLFDTLHSTLRLDKPILENPNYKRIIESQYVSQVFSRWSVLRTMHASLRNPNIKIWSRNPNARGIPTKVDFDLLLELPRQGGSEPSLHSYLFCKEDSTVDGLFHPVSVFQTEDLFSLNQKNWKVYQCSLLYPQYTLELGNLFPNFQKSVMT